MPINTDTYDTSSPSTKVFKTILKKRKRTSVKKVKNMSYEHQWKTAISWVQSNHVLVASIAGPYRKHMASGSQDIEHEAMVAAFCTLATLAKKGQPGSKFGSYFRVQFRTRCIQMATGGIGNNFRDIDQIPFTSPEQECEEIDHDIIEQALQTMTNRQRQISRWILSRATPVSTNLIAREFGICGRTVRNIVCGAIKRVEENGKQNANPKVCESISYTSKNPVFAR